MIRHSHLLVVNGGEAEEERKRQEQIKEGRRTQLFVPGVELTEDQYNDRKKRANRPSLRPEEGKKVIFF